MSRLIYSYKIFNPLLWHVRESMHNVDIRYIWLRGGSSSGKSVSTVQAILLALVSGEGSALVLRKVSSSIRNTIYEEFKVQAKRLHVYDMLRFTENNITCQNGYKIDFSGLDDPEKIKSITNYRWIVMEEATEFEYEDYTQITFRLRGKVGLQVIAMFNPISEDHWINTKILNVCKWTVLSNNLYGKIRDVKTGKILPADFSSITGKRINQSKNIYNERTGKYEEYNPDTIELISTYQDNFWVVGSPDGKYGYYDKQTIANYQWYKDNDYNYYRVYALGEWGSIKTGGEFLYAFDSNKHIQRCPYTPGMPIHISIDNNVLPYISVSFFQIIGRNVKQIHEICAEDPFNTVTKASSLAVDYLKKLGYNDVVYLYGDASTRQGNTIDDQKRTFLDKFIEGLETSYHVEERIPRSNPSVSMSGEFINYILSGALDISFCVDDGCRNSIVDYNCAKKDVNGNILKTRIKDKVTGQSYEKYGHLTDCLRYVMIQVFNSDYNAFSLHRKRSVQHEDEFVYYNASTSTVGQKVNYVLPSINGYMIVLSYNIHDTSIDLSSVLYIDRFDIDKLYSCCDGLVIFDSKKEFFYIARELRKKGLTVRIISSNISQYNVCIEANRENAFANVRINSDYEKDMSYNQYIQDILDYSGDKNFEALYSFCLAYAYIRRNIN